MKPDFEELDYCNTPMGEITLRRRTEPSLGVEVYEVKLGDEFLALSVPRLAQAHVVEFQNPLQGRKASNTIYLACGVKELKARELSVTPPGKCVRRRSTR